MDKVVKRQDGCWEWTAKRTRDGYGSFWNGEHYDAQRTKPVTVLAHGDIVHRKRAWTC